MVIGCRFSEMGKDAPSFTDFRELETAGGIKRQRGRGGERRERERVRERERERERERDSRECQRGSSRRRMSGWVQGQQKAEPSDWNYLLRADRTSPQLQSNTMPVAGRNCLLGTAVPVVVGALVICLSPGSAAQPQRTIFVRRVPAASQRPVETALRHATSGLPALSSVPFSSLSLFSPASPSLFSSFSSRSSSSRVWTPVARCRTSDGRLGHCVSTLTGFCSDYPSLQSLLAEGPSLCSQSGPAIVFCCPDSTAAQEDRHRLRMPSPTPLPPEPERISTSASTRSQTLMVTSVQVLTLRPTSTVTRTQVVTVDVTKIVEVEPTRVVAPPSLVTARRPVPVMNRVLTPPPVSEITTTVTTTEQPTTTTTERPSTTIAEQKNTTTSTTSERATTTISDGPGRTETVVGTPTDGCGSGGNTSWMALLGSRDRWLCSGALIGPRLILTSASCVVSRPLANLIFRLGESDLSSSSDNTTDMAVQRAVLHPQRTGERHDLALLKLSGPAASGPPICLPESAPGPASDLTAPSRLKEVLVTLGWGFSPLSAGQPTVTTLTVTPVRRIPTADCDASFRQLPTYLREFPAGVGAEVCVAALQPDGPGRRCPVDRGSPLLSVDTDGGATLQGVGRLSAGCGSDVLPNVFINVQSYLPWIKSVARRL